LGKRAQLREPDTASVEAVEVPLASKFFLFRFLLIFLQQPRK
jgi:hypothetical protein